jgi:hypothetical protein
MQQAAQAFFQAVAISPDAVAAQVFAAIDEERFYILTHPGVKQQVVSRMQAIIDDGAPACTGPENFPLD